MNAKSLVIFLVVAGAVVWFATKDDKPTAKPQTLVAPAQQRQMEKASNLDKEMQKSLDQRMKSDPSAE